MIKQNQIYITTLQVISDALVIAGSLLLAYWIRFVSAFFIDGPRVMNYVDYLHLLIFVIPIYLVIYYIFGLYTPYRNQKLTHEIQRIFFANTVAILMLITYLYYTKDINYSRLMLGYFYIASNLFISIERFLFRKLISNLRSKGKNLKQVMVVGAGEVGQSFVKKIQEEKQLGYQVVGYIDDYFPKKERNGIPILGTTQDLEALLLDHPGLDEVVIALPNTSYKKINKVIDICEFSGVKTQVIPDYVNLIQGSKAYFDEIDGIPLVNTRYIPLDNPFNDNIKRIFDVVASSALLLLSSPFLAVIALLVKTTSPGPVFYKQQRVGRNRKEFTIYKFRSMIDEQPDKGQKGWTVKDDPRKTVVGKYLRKFSIDELPQLFNVIKGDMSLVGPRPELPHWVDKYRETIPHYMIKHHVRPGITGWAQVNGYRGDTDISERIKKDIEYIENWSPWLDFKIILKTPKAMTEGE